MPQRHKELVTAYLQQAVIFSTNLIGRSGFKGWQQSESLSLSESLITENAAHGLSRFFNVESVHHYKATYRCNEAS